MTHEEINEAIAEHLYRGKGDLEIFLKHPHRRDFCNDLNAMHEAEKVLRKVIYPTDTDTIIGNRMHDYAEHLNYAFDATAEQRARAFLKTLNLWK